MENRFKNARDTIAVLVQNNSVDPTPPAYPIEAIHAD
jgi:hypothetical protein